MQPHAKYPRMLSAFCTESLWAHLLQHGQELLGFLRRPIRNFFMAGNNTSTTSESSDKGDGGASSASWSYLLRLMQSYLPASSPTNKSMAMACSSSAGLGIETDAIFSATNAAMAVKQVSLNDLGSSLVNTLG